ncbi:hypothetical protein RHSIM_Rhsim06G0065800 [Rhododendron simsii]|uniref:Uncharacterized protein n=1 Tax=Rhododendron simsii TaxID=118357 RepID=A0A834GTA0_RHOSS|nr:hypothetical protein RHSIM_Rhsim06G0065800 [Rhododendron simsii]
MGRAPCCDKANVKKGPWSPEEDTKLKSYIEQHGTGGNWIALPQKIGLRRCGKSCRLRWLNYLRPNIKHGEFSEEEDNVICSLYISIGSRWSIIAAQLPGRTDNDIKNYWNTRLKKKLLGKHRKAHQPRKASSLKQGTRKGIDDHSLPAVDCNANNQQPYWPELPVLAASMLPCSSQEPRFSDHASIRKLLMKLGGEFSDGDNPNLQYPVNGISSTLQPYLVPSIEMVSPASNDALNACTSHLENNHYNIDGQGMAILSGFQPDYDEMVYENPPQRLDGLEFLFGDMVRNGAEMNSRESFEWGEMSSTMSYPPMISNYEAVRQGILQD